MVGEPGRLLETNIFRPKLTNKCKWFGFTCADKALVFEFYCVFSEKKISLFRDWNLVSHDNKSNQDWSVWETRWVLTHMSNIPNSIQNLEYFAQEITFTTEENVGNVVLRVSLSWGHIAAKFEKSLEIEIYRTLRSHIGWHWKKMRCQLKIQSSWLKNWSFVVCIFLCAQQEFRNDFGQTMRNRFSNLLNAIAC